MAEQDPDGRIGTNHTNVAASWGALGIAIKNVQPCTLVKDAETGVKTGTYFFEECGKGKVCGQRQAAEVIDWAWRHKDEFERRNPRHPFNHIRRGLESREWLTKVKYGEKTITALNKPRGYKTDDINKASCLRGTGHTLLAWEKPYFVFGKIQVAEFEDQFDNYQVKELRETPVGLIHRALVIRMELIDLINRAPVQISYTKGDTQGENFSQALIGPNCPPELRAKLLEIFDEDF